MITDTHDNSICKNCKASIDGSFCSKCGQKAKTVKVSFKYLLQEIPNSVFQVDCGLLYTIKQLFTRPGHSIREYIEGKRVRHFKPISFALLLSTIYAICIFLVGKVTFMADAVNGFTQAMTDAENNSVNADVVLDSSKLILSVIIWMKDNYSYATLLIVPCFSLASYVSFVDRGYNYFEHLILNLYIEGQKMFIYLVFIPLLLFVKSDEVSDYLEISIILIVFFTGLWTYFQFFKNEKYLSTFLRLVLSYIISFILFNIVLVIAIIVLVINN